MRRYLVPLLAALLALGLVAPTAVAGSKGGHDGHGRVTQLTLYATEVSATTITREGEVFEGDEEEFSPNVGDRFIAIDALYLDEGRTEEAGRNHIQCTVTEVEGELPTEEPAEGEEVPFFRVSFVCSGVVDVFDQGTLTWSGVASFSSEDFAEDPTGQPFATLAITGGTAAYIGAAGEVVLFDESTADDESLTRYEVTLLKTKRR